MFTFLKKRNNLKASYEFESIGMPALLDLANDHYPAMTGEQSVEFVGDNLQLTLSCGDYALSFRAKTIDEYKDKLASMGQVVSKGLRRE